jgi:HSP20 family protein
MSTGTMKRSTTSAATSPETLPAKARASRDPIQALRDEMNDLMARIWGGNSLQLSSVLTPALDLSETDNAYDIHLDMPGMKPDDIDIQVQGNVVRISGQRAEEKEEKNATYHCIERQTGSMSRTVTLPCDVNEDEVAAEYTNGVLTVKLPKSEQAKAKKIAVRS